jgi:phosphate transport system substrate-binding protein
LTIIGSKRLAPLAIAAAFVFAACGSSSGGSTPTTAPTTGAASGVAGPTACESGSLTAGGSTALQPLVDAAAKQYEASCTAARIDVQGGGSGTGLTQVVAGAFQIGNSDVKAEDKLKPEDASTLVDHIVARQGWVMVLNRDVTGVTNLTKQQATDIWTGKVTNWKDVGGNDEAIVLVIRPASSGTRSTFKKVVLGGAEEAQGTALQEDSNGAVAQAVSTTGGSTSVVGFAFYQQNKDKLTAVGLEGVEASVDNMKNGTYLLQADGHMYTKGQPSGLAKSFLDYITSADVQNSLLPSLFYAPAGK